MTRGRIVAGLSFGFWSRLFGPRCEELWRHRLRHAFPLAKERKDLSARMEALRRFRNRLAHHDSILFQPVAARHDDMLEIAGLIDPAAMAWLRASSRVDDLLAARPASRAVSAERTYRGSHGDRFRPSTARGVAGNTDAGRKCCSASHCEKRRRLAPALLD